MLIRFFKRTVCNGLMRMAGEVHDLPGRDAAWLLRKKPMSCRQVGVYDATNAAEELAAEHGVDLELVRGTGKRGRILQSDVERVVAGDAGVGPTLFG